MKKIRDLNFKINMKSIMYFEEMEKKSFYQIDSDDIFNLVFSIITVNNPDLNVTKEELMSIMENNEKITKDIFNDLEEELKCISYSISKEKTNTNNEEPDKVTEIPKLTDIISMLIIQYHMDANYVLYKMNLWEIKIYAEAIEKFKKNDMVEKRFWTYLNIMPHVDTRKIGGPEKFLPFEWEIEEKKKSGKSFLDENKNSIKNLLKID